MNRRQLRKYHEAQDLDWRDPSMPVIRHYKFPNGRVRIEVDPEYEQRLRQHYLEASPVDDYYNDPTYNLRRK